MEGVSAHVTLSFASNEAPSQMTIEAGATSVTFKGTL